MLDLLGNQFNLLEYFFFLLPEVAESVMGGWGLPAELVPVPLPQGATQEHASGLIRCCSSDLLFLEGTLKDGVFYNDLCVSMLSSAGGWDPFEGSCGCEH